MIGKPICGETDNLKFDNLENSILTNKSLLLTNHTTIPMSTVVELRVPEQTQALDKWDKLANLLEYGTDEVIEELKATHKLRQICINGFTNALTRNSKSRSETTVAFNAFLKELGFTSNEIYQKRMCPLNGCPFHAMSMATLMNHMIGYHDVPIKTLARLVSVIKNDSRETKKGVAAVKNVIQTIHMNTE